MVRFAKIMSAFRDSLLKFLPESLTLLSDRRSGFGASQNLSASRFVPRRPAEHALMHALHVVLLTIHWTPVAPRNASLRPALLRSSHSLLPLSLPCFLLILLPSLSSSCRGSPGSSALHVDRSAGSAQIRPFKA